MEKIEKLGHLLPDNFWSAPTIEVTRNLLGKIVVCLIDGELVAGRIAETESYLWDDPASHSFRGKTPRNAPMFGQAGTVYVYFTYGNHYCLNFVTGPYGIGEAVLIRAMQPLEGFDIMAARRGRNQPKDLLSGPGKICQAMAIHRGLNYHRLDRPPLMLLDDGFLPADVIARPRIGISVAADELLRFYPAEMRYWVSKK